MRFLFNRDFYCGLFRFLGQWIVSFILAAWTHTFGLFTLKARSLIGLGIRHYQVKAFEQERRIKAIPVEKVFKKLFCEVVFPEEASGGVSLFELVVLGSFVRTYRPRNIFEFGTFQGRTTLNFALNSPAHARIVTLDLPREDLEKTRLQIDFADRKHIDKPVSGEFFLKSALPVKKKISQVFGDSAVFDFSPYAGTMDFIFIDGSHHYEYVKNDSEKALGLLKKRKGIIIWHDYGYWPGVTRALNELARSRPWKNIRSIQGSSLAFVIF